MKTCIVAATRDGLNALAEVIQASGIAFSSGGGFLLPSPFSAPPGGLRTLVAQAPEAVLVDLPYAEEGIEAALAFMEWLRTQLPHCAVMAIGALDAPQLIVRAMRAGANEFLERPLRATALTDAMERCARLRSASGGGAGARGQLVAIVGARGGCGTTTIAVNLALALQAVKAAGEREGAGGVLLLDAAPLGHVALHLNLKPQFDLRDLLEQTSRLDASLLQSLLLTHESGLHVIAGVRQPLPAALAEGGAAAACLDLLLRRYRVVVVDLSARLDELTRSVQAQAERLLLVTQPDMVSLWSAATVRQYLDASLRLRFELVLNACSKAPAVDKASLEELTRTPVLDTLPYDRTAALAAVEGGQPVMGQRGSELGRGLLALSAKLLGGAEKKSRGWLPFLRTREMED